MTNEEKMTPEEAIAIIRKEYLCVDRDCDIDRSCGKCDLMIPSKEPILQAYEMAIQALENHDTFMKYAYSQGKHDALSQEPTISRLERRVDDNTVVFRTIDGKEIEYVRKEPCDDAISRDAVKELIKCGVSTDTYDDVEQVCKWIDALPPVTQKSGKWINDECGNVICSECKRFRRDCRYGHTNYCNHCGAEMVEPQESEE